MCKDSPKPSSVGRQAQGVGRWGADLVTGRRMVDALGDPPLRKRTVEHSGAWPSLQKCQPVIEVVVLAVVAISPR